MANARPKLSGAWLWPAWPWDVAMRVGMIVVVVIVIVRHERRL